MYKYLIIAFCLFYHQAVIAQLHQVDSGRIYVSEDQGESWKRSDKGIPADAIVNDILEREDRVLIATEQHGIYMSDGQMRNWHLSSKGLPPKKINAIHDYDGGIYAGSNERGIYRSDDEGTSWYALNEGLTNLIIRAFFTFNSVLIAGTNDGVFVLDKNKWRQLKNNIQINDFEQINNTLFVATNRGVFIASSPLDDWKMILPNMAFQTMTVFEETIVGMTYNSEIVKMDAKGQIRNDLYFRIPRSRVHSITSVDDHIFGQMQTGFFKSYDGGNTWHLVSPGDLKDTGFRYFKNTKFGLMAGAGKGGC